MGAKCFVQQRGGLSMINFPNGSKTSRNVHAALQFAKALGGTHHGIDGSESPAVSLRGHPLPNVVSE